MATTSARAEHPVRAEAFRLRRSHVVHLVGAVGPVTAFAAILILSRADAWSLAAADQVPVDASVAFSCSIMGAVVVRGGRAAGARQVGWVLLVGGTASGLAGLTCAYAITATDETWLVSLAVQLQSMVWVPGFVPLLALVPLLYPDGLLPGRDWRAAALASLVGLTLLTFGVGLYPEPLDGRLTLGKPLTSESAAQVLTAAGALLLVPAIVAGLVALGLRLRRAEGLARKQVLVLLLAAATLLGVTLLQGRLPTPTGPLLQAAAVALLPVAIGVAVTRHRLYDLDRALRRALVGLSLAICVAGAYLTALQLFQALMPGAGRASTALAAGAVGLAVHPLAVRLTRGVDRLYYGDRADPQAVASRLAARLTESGLDVGLVPAVVCETVVESLRLGSAELVVEVDGRESTVARAAGPERPQSRGAARRFELLHRGHRVGWLVVEPRDGEAEVDRRDVEILTMLADQAAPAVASVRLHDRLQQSREALVLAREEERRRLRRDLHDGVGAALAGVRLQLESAQELVTDETADRLLANATAGVVQAVQDVRRVTDDLRPAVIDELGLVEALTVLADRVRTPSLDVRVAIADLPPLPAAVEVCCYRITAEALANVVRHAGASAVSVSVEVRDGTLALEVRDDGRGIGGADGGTAGSGLGLASMRRRAEEIGGSCTITDDAGTRVEVLLPLGGGA